MFKFRIRWSGFLFNFYSLVIIKEITKLEKLRLKY